MIIIGLLKQIIANAGLFISGQWSARLKVTNYVLCVYTYIILFKTDPTKKLTLLARPDDSFATKEWRDSAQVPWSPCK